MPIQITDLLAEPSVPVRVSRDAVAPADGVTAAEAKRLLQAVWWQSRKWVEPLAVSEPHRVDLIDLCILADDLIRAGDYSFATLANVGDLLCAHCRRLGAWQGDCGERRLDRCSLLRASSH